MPMSNDTITASCEITIEAAEGGDGKKSVKFSSSAYNGGILKTRRYPNGIVIDLSGMEFDKQILANLNHDETALVGHVEDKRNDGRSVQLSGVISYPGDAANSIITASENKFPWQASVEVAPFQGHVESIQAGKKVTVNGQVFTGPIQVARKSKLYAVAFVPRGADANATVTIAATSAHLTEENSMFEDWVKGMGLDVATLTDSQKAKLQEQYDIIAGANSNNDNVPVPEFDLDGIKAAHGEYVCKLETIFAEREDTVPGAKFNEIKAGALKSARELKAKAIKEKWSPERFEVEYIKAASACELAMVKAERPVGPAIHAPINEIGEEVIEAALCQSLQVPNIEKQYSDKVLQTAHTSFKGRMGLQEAIIMAAAHNGLQVHHGERIHAGNIRSMLKAAFADNSIHASGYPTVSLPGIFSNVANKELLAGYMEEDQTWREISAIRTATDFKQVTAYRLLDSMAYEELGPNGEIKRGKIGEESFTRQAKTYAKMFALTRVDIINDDLGAFDDLRNRLGRGAAQKFNDIFWAAFMDNSSFFTSGNNNYITGATTNLATDGVGLGLGVKAFRTMTSPTADGAKRVSGRPEILLVPPELEAAAETLYKATNLASVKAADANIYANKYRPVVCAWLSDSAFTGYSTTAWYLLNPPTMRAAMHVSFLNGVQTPTVESAEADFDTLGVQFRGYHDWGCDKAEYFAGVKSKGAA